MPDLVLVPAKVDVLVQVKAMGGRSALNLNNMDSYMLRDGLVRWSLIILLCFIALQCANAQSICFNYQGSWSSWKNSYYTTGILETPKVRAYTDGSGLVLINNGGIEIFKFHINNYTPPSKAELKQHRKSGDWFEYQGTVEYYVTDQYPTAQSFAKANELVSPNPRKDETPSVKRYGTATIKIAPYKTNPKVYNIWFDGIGVGLSVQGLHFKGQKRSKNAGRIVANIFQSILLFPYGIGSWWWNPVYDDN